MTCPCKLTTPCDAHCTCSRGHMSGGCRRCCSYGNKQQRLQAAKRLARVIDSQPELLAVCQELLRALDPAAGREVSFVTRDEMQPLAVLARAAIAKATVQE